MPVAAPPPVVEPPASLPSPAIAPAPTASPTRVSKPARRIVFLVAALVVLALGIAAFLFRRDLPALFRRLTSDPLITRLLREPIPATSIPDWRVSDAPDTMDRSGNRDPGEAGTVLIGLRQTNGEATADVMFTVFKEAAQAQSSYTESVNDLKRFNTSVVTPPGLTATCTGNDERVATCRSVAGRTVVFATFLKGGLETGQATALMKAMDDRVAAE